MISATTTKWAPPMVLALLVAIHATTTIPVVAVTEADGLQLRRTNLWASGSPEGNAASSPAAAIAGDTIAQSERIEAAALKKIQDTKTKEGLDQSQASGAGTQDQSAKKTATTTTAAETKKKADGKQSREPASKEKPKDGKPAKTKSRATLGDEAGDTDGDDGSTQSSGTSSTTPMPFQALLRTPRRPREVEADIARNRTKVRPPPVDKRSEGYRRGPPLTRRLLECS